MPLIPSFYYDRPLLPSKDDFIKEREGHDTENIALSLEATWHQFSQRTVSSPIPMKESDLEKIASTDQSEQDLLINKSDGADFPSTSNNDLKESKPRLLLYKANARSKMLKREELKQRLGKLGLLLEPRLSETASNFSSHLKGKSKLQGVLSSHTYQELHASYPEICEKCVEVIPVTTPKFD